MFPIIPQYMIGKSAVAELSKTSVPVRLKESQNKITVKKIVNKNDESENIEILELFSQPMDMLSKVKIFSNVNTLKSNCKSWSWLKCLPLAENCQSHNLELSLSSSKSGLRLRAVHKILPDEKLILWFSRDLLVFLQIPYLTPSNIQGGTQYVCHKCSFQCEMPNPLKLHLALDCGRETHDDLWLRFLSLTPQLEITNGVEVQMKSEKSNSAFKPYTKSATSAQLPSQEAQIKFDLCPLLPETQLKPLIAPELNPSFFYKQAAEMEAIVSNLGRFKQGHLCIYCGKVYSRKYGLKIHIRTHTGFKPLKCKVCSRPFGDPSNLNKHVRLHSEKEAPYKCDQCGKLLIRRRDLERHLKSRHCIM